MGEQKTVEQAQAEAQQIEQFYQAMIADLKAQIGDLSYEVAFQKTLNSNKEASIQGLLRKVEELEAQVSGKAEGDTQ